jgi:uncharacterized protein (DUF433 family)
MTSAAKAIPVPLRPDEHGAIRVGKSQVLLDVVIGEYHRGTDPESIVHAYPTLELADVDAVIAYYLHHRDEVDAYILKGRDEATRLRREIESKQPDREQLRAKLLARKAERDQAHASTRQ